MDMLRTKVARKVGQFVRQAQAQPPAAAPVPAPAAPQPGMGAPPAPKPPMAMPAAPKPPTGPVPPGVPGAKPKEEIEQDVEKDIRRRKEQEKQLGDLSEKVTNISDQMEGLTKGINTLVNVLQKEVGDSTDFEKKFDDLKEEEDGDERSSTEFGLGKNDESLVKAKEDKMANAATLRDARKQRLNAEEQNFGIEPLPENKKYKQVVPAPQVTKLKEETKDWDKFYNKLTAANLALDLNASGTEWSVVDKTTDQVFFKIHPTTATANTFATKAFAEAIIADVKTLGIGAAMQKNSAEPFSSDLFKRDEGGKPAGDKPAGKPFESDLLKPKKDVKKPFPMKKKPEVKKDFPLGDKLDKPLDKPADKGLDALEDKPDLGVKAAENEPTSEVSEPEGQVEVAVAPVEPVEHKEASIADYRQRFVRAFRLALSAQQKNLADNPLKASWYETLVEFSVPDPEKVIEATFARAAAEHFEVALAKTAEYLNMGDEGFIELEAQIGELDTKLPQITASADLDRTDELKIRADALRARAHRSSLPLSSSSESVEQADRLSGVLPKPKLHGIQAFKR